MPNPQITNVWLVLNTNKNAKPKKQLFVVIGSDLVVDGWKLRMRRPGGPDWDTDILKGSSDKQLLCWLRYKEKVKADSPSQTGESWGTESLEFTVTNPNTGQSSNTLKKEIPTVDVTLD